LDSYKMAIVNPKWHSFHLGIEYAQVGSRKMMFNFKTR
jgi:hypothetical protein